MAAGWSGTMRGVPVSNAEGARAAGVKPMIYFDSVLLSVVERLCHWFQRLTGRTNVWLALQLTNLSVIVYFTGAAMYFWTLDLAPRIAFGLFCAALLYTLTQTVFRVPIEVYEHDAYRRVARGMRNSRRVRDVLLRISFLTLSFVLATPTVFLYLAWVGRPTVFILSYSLIVLTTIVLYLLACDPLPPCVGRVRAWLQRPARSPIPVGEGAGLRARPPPQTPAAAI
jgi:hypothetical protein